MPLVFLAIVVVVAADSTNAEHVFLRHGLDDFRTPPVDDGGALVLELVAPIASEYSPPALVTLSRVVESEYDDESSSPVTIAGKSEKKTKREN